MKRMMLVIQWLLAGWPIGATLILVPASLLLFYLFNFDKVIVQKIGTLLQLTGAVTVLYSLNKNMGMFRQANLRQRVRSWIKSFPLIKRNMTVQLAGAIQGQFSAGDVNPQQWNETWTAEQKIEELKKRIATCFEKIGKTDQAIREKIESVRAELKSDLLKNSQLLAEVKSQLASTVISGVNPQLFGVLLGIYGTVLLIY